MHGIVNIRRSQYSEVALLRELAAIFRHGVGRTCALGSEEDLIRGLVGHCVYRQEQWGDWCRLQTEWNRLIEENIIVS